MHENHATRRRRKRWQYYVAAPLLMMAALELLAWAVDARYEFHHRLHGMLDQSQQRDEPVEPQPPAPDGSVNLRLDADEPRKMPYVIGGRTIKDDTPYGKRDRVLPTMLPDDDKRRLFVVGGSAAYGYPYAYQESVAAQLQQRLDNTHVFNCAEPGAPSAGVVPVVHTLVEKYNADTIILFTGNNELAWWLMPKQARYGKRWLILMRTFSHSRALATVQYGVMRPLMDHQDTLRRRRGTWHIHHEIRGAAYAMAHTAEKHTTFDPTGWPTTKRIFLDQYERNLRSMIDDANARGVRMVVLTIPFNYRLSPAWKHPQPFALDPSKREAVEQILIEASRRLNDGAISDALLAADKAVALDPDAPLPHYFRAMALEAAGRHLEAELAYAECRETMAGHLGSMLSINRTIRDVAASTGVELLDVKKLFDEHQHAQGKYYNELLIHDDCHPTPEGNRLIADKLARRLK